MGALKGKGGASVVIKCDRSFAITYIKSDLEGRKQCSIYVMYVGGYMMKRREARKMELNREQSGRTFRRIFCVRFVWWERTSLVQCNVKYIINATVLDMNGII